MSEIELNTDTIKNLNKSLFSSITNRYSVSSIADNLKKNGYVSINDAIPIELIDTILAEVESKPLCLNVNDVAPVRYFRQKFFAHILAGSPTLVKLITDSFVLDLCREHLGPLFRLKCQRYYESGEGYQLGWHTDNKTVDNQKTDVHGLVFIIYLSDATDGELQVVKGSNNWSGEALSNDFTDEELRRDHEKDILSLTGPRGTLVITDTYTVHRTRLITTPGFMRKSLFFQVDDDLMHSEKIIVNTEYLPPMNEELMRYLGFGLPSGYKSMPQSGLHTLNNKDLVGLATGSFKELLKRVKGVRQLADFLRKKPKKNQNVINGY